MTTVRDISSLGHPAAWFSSAGVDGDVTISSRARLSRNLAEYAYPRLPGAKSGRNDGDVAAATLVSRVIRDELMPDVLGAETLDVQPRTMDRNATGLLAERRLMREPLPRRLFVAGDESVDLAVGAVDHLQIAARAAGSSIGPALERARTIDRKLESVLNYAVSLDLGYLSSQITNLGTALRASMLLHLPAITRTGRVAELEEAIAASDFSLVPDERLNVDGEERTFYLLSNERTIGLEEEAITAKLEDHARALVHYERIAREELVASCAGQLADTAYRSLGILRCARLLTADEALALLGRLRLGVVTNLVSGVPLETVTALLFLSGDSHVRIAVQERARPVDQGEENLQAERAARMREALSG